MNSKAEELMIGDWVVYEGDVNYESPVRIEGLDIATRSLITSDREDVGFDGVEPIPLTPEILEENGFCEMRQYGPYVYYLLEGIGYSVSISNKFDQVLKLPYWRLDIGNRATDANLSINFIHELQHALRLCGVDKEIIL